MRPVRQPKQQTVSSSKENEKRHVGKRNDTGTVADLAHQLVSTIWKIAIGLKVGISFEYGQGVDGDDVHNEQSLASSWDDSETQNRSTVFLAKSGRVDEVGVQFASKTFRDRDESKKGERNRDKDT